MVRVAINGFGRIGRRVLRAALDNKKVQIVAVNDQHAGGRSDPPVQVRFRSSTVTHDVQLEGNQLPRGRQNVRLTAEKDPNNLPWKELGVDIVMECTGIFTDKAKASAHLERGRQEGHHLGSLSKDADLTICMGINQDKYDNKLYTVVSNAWCTGRTRLAPVAMVLDEHFGIVRGFMTTIHSYTNDQNVLDLPHKDLRRARAAALSMIPTSTGAAKAIGLVLPHLKGKLDGSSIRVPTPNVSVVDLTAELSKAATREEINAKFLAASTGSLKGILGYVTDPLVSHDFNGNELSSIVDSELTAVISGNLVKVVAWYDNESGFSLAAWSTWPSSWAPSSYDSFDRRAVSQGQAHLHAARLQRAAQGRGRWHAFGRRRHPHPRGAADDQVRPSKGVKLRARLAPRAPRRPQPEALARADRKAPEAALLGLEVLLTRCVASAMASR